MEVDVEYILNQILENLSVEQKCYKFDSGLKSSYTNSKSSLDVDSVQNKYLYDSDTYILPQQNGSSTNLDVNYNKIEDIQFRKSNDEFQATDNSSGFVDVFSTKVTYNNNLSDNFLQNTTNSSITKTESGDILNLHGNNDNIINKNPVYRIITSTPKKEINDKAVFYNSFRESSSNDADSFNENVLNESCEKDDEYLNKTIDEAIKKYEKSEKKFKEVCVQTSFEDFCANCNNSLNNFQTEKQKTSTATQVGSPPPKKIKTEKNSITSFNNMKIAEELKKPEFSPTPEKICRNEQMTILINQFPLRGPKTMSAKEGDSGFLKIPRIRVGLSKRAKLRFK